MGGVAVGCDEPREHAAIAAITRTRGRRRASGRTPIERPGDAESSYPRCHRPLRTARPPSHARSVFTSRSFARRCRRYRRTAGYACVRYACAPHALQCGRMQKHVSASTRMEPRAEPSTEPRKPPRQPSAKPASARHEATLEPPIHGLEPRRTKSCSPNGHRGEGNLRCLVRPHRLLPLALRREEVGDAPMFKPELERVPAGAGNTLSKPCRWRAQ